MTPRNPPDTRWLVRMNTRLGRAARKVITKLGRAKPSVRSLGAGPAGLDRPQDPPRPLRIRAGRLFPAETARRLPIVVIVITSLRAGEAEDLAREVEVAQLMTGTFRPLFVIDTADFGPFRRRGFVVERVMPAEELAAANPEDDYGEYLYGRLSSIVRAYGATSVVPVPGGSLPALRGPLLRLIGAGPAILAGAGGAASGGKVP